MAESSQEKTEDPTPRRLRQAREKGQVARSQDLMTALMLGLSLGVLAALSTSAAGRMERALLSVLAVIDEVHAGALGTGDVLSAARAPFAAAEAILLPLLLALMLGSLAFGFAQVGALLTSEPLRPDLKRLDPIAGLKKLFFGLDPFVELLRALLKVVIVGAITWKVVGDQLGVVLTLLRLDALAGAGVLAGIVLELALWITGALGVLGLLDLFYQRHKHTKGLRMSKEEVKEEYKSQEGDPQHKSRRRRAHKEVLDHSMVQEVAKAHVVVTNPTHYACALRYDPEEEGAPRLLAKGQDHLALRMIELARELRIPIVRNIGLARALHDLELDEEIPEELFEAASTVLIYLQDLAHAEGRLAPWEGHEGSGGPEQGARDEAEQEPQG